jgi:hypothetical protein
MFIKHFSNSGKKSIIGKKIHTHKYQISQRSEDVLKQIGVNS